MINSARIPTDTRIIKQHCPYLSCLQLFLTFPFAHSEFSDWIEQEQREVLANSKSVPIYQMIYPGTCILL